MIDLFSVCIEEHLTDCGIVVIHILEEPLLGEPLLGHGFCEGLDLRPVLEKDSSVDPISLAK